jgi:hypothetical protein
MGAVFAHVLRDPIKSESSLVIASDTQLSAAAVRDAPVPSDLQPLARASAGRIGAPLAGGSVFTDDRAPVEWLVDTSIVQYAAGGEGG